MTALSEFQVCALSGVIEQAPDAAVDRLERSLLGDVAGALGPVRDLVRVECEDRRARAAVFGPLLPLCGPDRGDVRPAYPRALPSRLWRALKLKTPRGVEAAVIISQRLAPPDGGGSAIYDSLCREAAAGLRDRSEDFAAIAEALDATGPGAAGAFAGLLDVAPVARATLQRLPEWMNHMNEDAAAAARLAFKDATQVAEDAGLRLMEILFAHMEEPSRILRLICAVMDRPGESYVAAS